MAPNVNWLRQCRRAGLLRLWCQTLFLVSKPRTKSDTADRRLRARDVDAFLIDEIGKMECHCPQFIEAIRRLLEGPLPLVASIALRGGGFIAEVKNRPDVQVVEVTQGNRDTLPGQIVAWVKQRRAQANTP